MRQRWPRLLVCGCLVAAVTVACGSDEDSPTVAAPDVSAAPNGGGAAPQLPPSTLEGLAPLFQPLVDPFGVRLTRGSLADTNTRQYDAAGRHLALYVEPTTAWTDTEFVTTIAPLTRALAPEIFRRWPDLESFDVCQEPFPGTEGQPEDASLTIVDMTREVSDSIDWATADLTTLLVAAIEYPGRMHVAVTEPLNQDALYQLAQSQARERTGGSGNPSE